MDTQEAIQDETRQRWAAGDFIERGVLGEVPPEADDLPWTPYEGFMRAKILRGTPGEVGDLVIQFPPGACEDNIPHIHPDSDRVVHVVQGSGVFVAQIGGELRRFPLKVGDRVWMPRGMVHTFEATDEGLLVRATHNPFIDFEDPRCLTYPTST